jgi:hypothetical protein
VEQAATGEGRAAAMKGAMAELEAACLEARVAIDARLGH